MLQSYRVTASIVSELLRLNQQGGKITPPPPTRLPQTQIALGVVR